MKTNVDMKTTLLGAISTAVPYSLIERIARPPILIPYYHIISDDDVVHTKHLYRHKGIREFTEDMDFLLLNYTPLSLPQVIDIVRNRRPFPSKSFHLTFDDGFREMSDTVAPILLEKGIPATFFINTAFLDNQEMCYLNRASVLEEHLRIAKASGQRMQRIAEAIETMLASVCSRTHSVLNVNYRNRGILLEIEKVLNFDCNDYLREYKPYLTSEQVRGLLNKGFSIGAHSIDHPRYSSLPLEEQLCQTFVSTRNLRDQFGLPYGAFAFPHTDYGVSKEFFVSLYASKLVDVSFGTLGIADDMFDMNIQRVSFEKPVWPAQRLLRYHFARRLLKIVTGKRVLMRQ